MLFLNVTSTRLIMLPEPLDPVRRPSKNGLVLDEKVRKRIGARLVALRVQARLGQIAVAKKAGISPGTLQTIEWGARENREENIAKVAGVFHTTIEALSQPEHVAPSDPLLKDLNREDFEIARAYHNASSVVRHQARLLLRDRDPQHPVTPTSDELAIVAAQLSRLSDDRRQIVMDVLNEFIQLDVREDDAG